MFNRKSIASISLTLSIILMTPSVLSATKLSDFVMSTSTSAGSWSDPLGGGTYLSGGDFTMRLKSTSSHAPLFDYKLPSASVGCSGISISGGFLSFLGLDKLQNLLSDAGSSLMFGIILGLEFTLPAVSAVFAKIRAWANALQKLLQNGCNIGKAIAGGSALGKSMHSDWLDKTIKDTFPELDGFISEGEPKLLKAIEKLGNCNGDINDPNCKLLESSKTSIAKDIKTKAEKSEASIGVSGKLIGDGTQRSNSMKEIATAFRLSDFYTNKKITCPSVNTNSISDTDILMDQLKYLFFGDIAVDGYSVSRYASFIDNHTCTMKNSKVAAELSKTLTTGAKTSFPIPIYAKITPIINAKDVAEALMYGFEKIEGKYSSISSNVVNIPDRQIVYLDMPMDKSKVDSTKSTSRFRLVLVSSANIPTSSIQLTWNGAFKDSLKGIRAIVDSQTSHSWRLASSYSEYDTSSVGAGSIPLLLPGIKKYANIIAKMEKKNRGATEETRQLKVYLSKVNAINFAKLLMSGIESRVEQLGSGISGKPVAITAYLASIKKISAEVNIILEKTQKELEASDLTKKFREIETDQVKTSIKTQR